MKTIFFTLVIFLLSTVLHAQQKQKYFVFFKEKEVQQTALQKQSDLYKEALLRLSTEAIERRKKIADEIVSLEDIRIAPANIALVQQLGFTIVHELRWFNAVSGYASEEVLAVLKVHPEVKEIVPVRAFKGASKESELMHTAHTLPYKAENTLLMTNGAEYGDSYIQAALSEVQYAHAAGLTGNGVILGMLDTGFDWKFHDALKTRNIVAEYDFIFKDGVTANEAIDASSQHNHGTYVFSITAGYKDSALIGIAHNAAFLLAKTEDVRSEKNIEEDNYAAALEWMEARGVKITSSSLGYNIFDKGERSYTYEQLDGKTAVVTKAAELAFSKGVLTITSAGNEGGGSWKYIVAPADGINTIAVGAVSADDSVAAFSSRGPSADGRVKPDIVTMGVNVFGVRAGTTNQFTTGNGTSSAAPIAAGIAALLLEAHPHLTNGEMRRILQQTAASYYAPTVHRGYGLASAKRAIEFPTVEKNAGQVTLHKYFLDTLQLSSPVLWLSVDGIRYDSIGMTTTGAHHFTSVLNDESTTQYFYFTAVTQNGSLITQPSNGAVYKKYAGETKIELDRATIPGQMTLSSNYPNPFNAGTTFKVSVPTAGNGAVYIYNTIGERVRTLYNGMLQSGDNFFIWDGNGDGGIELSSGVYIYVVQAQNGFAANKAVFLK